MGIRPLFSIPQRMGTKEWGQQQNGDSHHISISIYPSNKKKREDLKEKDVALDSNSRHFTEQHHGGVAE